MLLGHTHPQKSGYANGPFVFNQNLRYDMLDEVFLPAEVES